MIQNIYIICGAPNSGKTTLVKQILNGKMYNKKPITIALQSGGTTNVLIPRSQALQEARKTPQDCLNELSALNTKFNKQQIDVVIVLRIKGHQQYITAIQNANYNIIASVVLDNTLPAGISMPKPKDVGNISQISIKNIYAATKTHFGW